MVEVTICVVGVYIKFKEKFHSYFPQEKIVVTVIAECVRTLNFWGKFIFRYINWCFSPNSLDFR